MQKDRAEASGSNGVAEITNDITNEVTVATLA